jgi:hypothetical protein
MTKQIRLKPDEILAIKTAIEDHINKIDSPGWVKVLQNLLNRSEKNEK